MTLSPELRPPLSAAQALLEADRCLECGGPHAAAPCVLACPAGIDVPSFVAAIAAGRPDEAATTIFAENLLGASCARVCPTEVMCEGACVLVHEGRDPIAIGSLQRFATDTALAAGIPLRLPAPPNGRRVAVVGAGPAGLSCAGELATLGYGVDVYDERDEVGGLVRYAIAPYRQLNEPLPDEARALEALGVRLHLGSPVRSHGCFEALAAAADAVFLGIGMGADTDVGYEGDELAGVWESLPFIEALKTGSPPIVGRRVVVVGGGNTAIDVARESLRLGADEVTLLYRRTRAELPAYPHEVDEAAEEGVRFRWLAAPLRFVGTRRLEGVECVEMRLGEPDSSGRRRPEPIEGSTFTIPADTAVKAIGQQSRPEPAAWGIELDPATGRTSDPKIFAGGDVLNGGASVVEAVAHGKRAARAIHAWLEETC